MKIFIITCKGRSPQFCRTFNFFSITIPKTNLAVGGYQKKRDGYKMFLPFLKLQQKKDFLLSHFSAWNFVVDKSKYIHKTSSLFCDWSGTRSMFNGLQKLSMLSLVEVCRNAPIHASMLGLKRKKSLFCVEPKKTRNIDMFWYVKNGNTL